MHLSCVRGGILGICQGGATHFAVLWHCMWGRGPRRNNAACSALRWLSVTSSATHRQTGPFWCWFPSGRFCEPFRTLWVSPTNCPVRLGVSLTTSTPTCFYRDFEVLFPCAGKPWLHGLSRSPVVPPGLSAYKCGTTSSTSHHLAYPVLQLPSCHESSLPYFPFPPLLPVWINVSSLSPWLSDFHTVHFLLVLVVFCF